jgi:hypothetical protein
LQQGILQIIWIQLLDWQSSRGFSGPWGSRTSMIFIFTSGVSPMGSESRSISFIQGSGIHLGQGLRSETKSEIIHGIIGIHSPGGMEEFLHWVIVVSFNTKLLFQSRVSKKEEKV